MTFFTGQESNNQEINHKTDGSWIHKRNPQSRLAGQSSLGIEEEHG
jgi:hypothetical protein